MTAEPSEPSPLGLPPQNKWEKWIQGIKFGSVVMAAVGLSLYALVIKQATTLESLLPYVVALIIIAVVLYGLDFGRRQAEKAEGTKWMGTALGILITFFAAGIGIIALICFGVVALRMVGLLPPMEAAFQPLPDEFHVETCVTYRCPLLSEKVFGPRNNEVARARVWMDLMEKGAEKEIGASTPYKLWLLTEPFKKYKGFTARVHAGSADGMAIVGYHVHPSAEKDKPSAFTPLRQLSGTGAQAVYEFDVPTSIDGDMLVVLLAMTTETFKKRSASTKFKITTRTTSGA